MARAMWRARLVVGDETVGVKLYAAVRDGGVRLHLLHAADGVRVRQRLVNPRTGREVAPGETRRGVEVERGRIVVLDDEELASLEPEASRDVVVEAFVPPDALDPRYVRRAYWLGPDGEPDRYAALVQALERRERVGIARWTMRKTRYVGALRVQRGRLALAALRHADEVLPLEGLRPPAGRAPDPRERELAERLVQALAGPYDPTAFRDEHRERVLALVEAKRRGETPEPEPAPRREAPSASLADALRASLEGAGAA